MADADQSRRNLDPGIRLVLEELRDLRVEMRADRQRADEERRQDAVERRLADEQWREERRQADARWQEELRQAAEQRREADERWQLELRQAAEERRLADEQWKEERRHADELRRREGAELHARFQESLREFREDSIRHAAEFRQAFKETRLEIRTAFKDVRTVGLAIVKTLNHHTKLLERIDRKLGQRGPGRPGQSNGRSR